MSPSQTGHGKPFLLYCAVALVSASSVVFGLDWTDAPLAPMPETEASVQAAKLAARFPPPVQRVAKVNPKPVPVAPAQSPQRRAPQIAAADPAAKGVRNVSPPPAIAEPEQTSVQPDTTAQPACDVAACSAAYRSFRAADCSWQPYEGPRRFCDKGTPPQDIASGDTGTTVDTTASIGGGDETNLSNKCDIAACKQAYFTFNPTDCTYQPSDGPRRLCTKGTPPKPDTAATDPAVAAANAANAANKTDQTDAGPPKCNVEACRQAYFTFTPADCTYQPSNGPRRLCTK
jgi:BA14K-like protein